MGVVNTTVDCASISTSTIAKLPTASYGVVGSNNVVNPTSESTSASNAAPIKRRFLNNSTGYDGTLVDHPRFKRALEDIPASLGARYEATMDCYWLQYGKADVTAKFSKFPTNSRATAGINGLCGCTSVIIVSAYGLYMSHIYEYPVFLADVSGEEFLETNDLFFTNNAFHALRDGTKGATSLTSLIGTDEDPGPLNALYHPEIFILTPLTDEIERGTQGVSTTLKYQDRVEQLAAQLATIFPDTSYPVILGYTRTDYLKTIIPGGIFGRAIVEYDPFQYWLASEDEPGSPPLLVGRWRLWLDGQPVAHKDFVNPENPHGPCKKSSSSSIASTAPSSLNMTNTTSLKLSPLCSLHHQDSRRRSNLLLRSPRHFLHCP